MAETAEIRSIMHLILCKCNNRYKIYCLCLDNLTFTMEMLLHIEGCKISDRRKLDQIRIKSFRLSEDVCVVLDKV